MLLANFCSSFSMDDAGTTSSSPSGRQQGKKSCTGKSRKLPLPPSQPLSMPLPPSPSISRPPPASPESRLPSAHEALSGLEPSSTANLAVEAEAAAAEAVEGQKDGSQSVAAERTDKGHQQPLPKLSKKQAKKAAQAAQAAAAASTSSVMVPVGDKADPSPSLLPDGSPSFSTAAAAEFGNCPGTPARESSAGPPSADKADNMFAALALDEDLEDPASARNLQQLSRQGLNRPDNVNSIKHQNQQATLAQVEHAHHVSKAQQHKLATEISGEELPQSAGHSLQQPLQTPHQRDSHPHSTHHEMHAQRLGAHRARAALQHQHGSLHPSQPQAQSNEPLRDETDARERVEPARLAHQSRLPASEAGHPKAEAVSGTNQTAANHHTRDGPLEHSVLHARPAAIAAAAGEVAKRRQPKVLTTTRPLPPAEQPHDQASASQDRLPGAILHNKVLKPVK